MSVVECGCKAGQRNDTVEEVTEGQVDDEDGGAAPQPGELRGVPGKETGVKVAMKSLLEMSVGNGQQSQHVC